jgi:hypothetical protein
VRALLLVMLVPGCTLLDVEVEAPEVCVSYPRLEVEGVPAGGMATIERSFTVDDLEGVHRLTDRDAEVRFVRASVVAIGGVVDLSFVEAASVTIAAGELTPHELYACEGTCLAGEGALDMAGADERDVVEYLRHDAVEVGLALTGVPPEEAWTLAVEVCFQANARYSYGDE